MFIEIKVSKNWFCTDYSNRESGVFWGKWNRTWFLVGKVGQNQIYTRQSGIEKDI